MYYFSNHVLLLLILYIMSDALFTAKDAFDDRAKKLKAVLEQKVDNRMNILLFIKLAKY